MKPHLSPEMVLELDPPKTSGKATVHLRATLRGDDDLVKRLLDEVAVIERKWGLV